MGAFISGLAGLLLIKYGQTGSFRWQGIYLKDGYTWCSTAVLAVGMYLVIQNSERKFWRFQVMQCIGKNTMGIFYLHILVLNMMQRYVFGYLTEYYSWFFNLVKAVIVVMICLAITCLGKKLPLIRELLG